MINANLFNAVETGNVEEVRTVLTEERINTSTYYGAKSIILAAKRGDNEIIKMLLESGENITRESFWRRTAQATLLGAVNSENAVILNLLLEYGAGADKKCLQKVLSEALLTGNNDLIDLLLAAGAKIGEIDADKLENPLLKEMLDAINQGNLSKIDSILYNGFTREMANILRSYSVGFANIFDNPEILSLFQSHSFFITEDSASKALIKSAENGNAEEVKTLLKEEMSGRVLLATIDAALKKGHFNIAQIIIEENNNLEPEIYTECLKKLFLGASNIGDMKGVKYFLEKIIEDAVGVFTDETGKGTLEIALENNPDDITIILLNYGFSKNSIQRACKNLFYIK